MVISEYWDHEDSFIFFFFHSYSFLIFLGEHLVFCISGGKKPKKQFVDVKKGAPEV